MLFDAGVQNHAHLFDPAGIEQICRLGDDDLGRVRARAQNLAHEQSPAHMAREQDNHLAVADIGFNMIGDPLMGVGGGGDENDVRTLHGLGDVVGDDVGLAVGLKAADGLQFVQGFELGNQLLVDVKHPDRVPFLRQIGAHGLAACAGSDDSKMQFLFHFYASIENSNFH